ncbi:hypothetical protein [Haloferax sp. Atlit-4N]|uniref:hypothetical protein n=1 Tax=Haloferax sp. Atlit-4N TaxID=2077206 RepID=UPI0011C0379B|nr:hypothetical protein [Haloferax sp. Atlit-4N]
MTRESAVTESITYHVEECRVCGSDVGLGTDIPEDELVKPGVAVLVGEGTTTISEERAGNWDIDIEFEGEQSDTNPPDVTGHILCTDCSGAIHGYTAGDEVYQGTLPDELTRGTGSPTLPISGRALVAIVVSLLLLVLLLIV